MPRHHTLTRAPFPPDQRAIFEEQGREIRAMTAQAADVAASLRTMRHQVAAIRRAFLSGRA